jgi:hypothetical protein
MISLLLANTRKEDRAVMFEIVFLGTGGGRFSMITQKRRTGGLRVISEKMNVHVDPGPGALIYSLQSLGYYLTGTR